MKESGLTSRLVKDIPEIMPGAIVFKHFDVSTDGIPDLSITWARKTLWAEIKYMDGETRPTQIVTMKALCQMGRAWYVRFIITHAGQMTIIYSPHITWDKDDPVITFMKGAPVFRKIGWDTKWVAKFFRKELEAA